MARITYDFIKNLSDNAINSLDRKSAQDLIREVRQKYNTRASQLEKVEEKVYSPAKNKMDEWLSKHSQVHPSKTSLKNAKKELFRMRDFFRAETSTVQGARRVMREQDKMLFGSTPSGRPKKRMTTAQRTKYWSLYHDFLKTNKTAAYIFGYKNIQNTLAEVVIGKKTATGDNLDNKLEVFDEVLSLLTEREAEYEYEEANVFSGRGND